MASTASAKPGMYRLLVMSGLLLVLLTLSVLLEARPSLGKWLMLTIPTVLIMHHLLQHRRRALQWLGFLVLFHFMTGVLQLFHSAPIQQVLGVLTVLCCLGIFVAAIVMLRADYGKQETVHEHLE